jgi:hypothetical protein
MRITLQKLLPALLSVSKLRLTGHQNKNKYRSVCEQVHLNTSKSSEHMKSTAMKTRNATQRHTAMQIFVHGHASTSRHLSQEYKHAVGCC